jgi:hypothetical protein
MMCVVGRYLVDKRLVVITASVLLTRLDTGHILDGWAQKLGAGLAAQPCPNICIVEQCRHATVIGRVSSFASRDHDGARSLRFQL